MIGFLAVMGIGLQLTDLLTFAAFAEQPTFRELNPVVSWLYGVGGLPLLAIFKIVLTAVVLDLAFHSYTVFILVVLIIAGIVGTTANLIAGAHG